MRTKTGNGHNVDVERFLEDLKLVVRDGQELLKAGISGVRQRALTGAQTTDRAVREHPYQTVAVVLGLGIAIGLICSGIFGRQVEGEEFE